MRWLSISQMESLHCWQIFTPQVGQVCNKQDPVFQLMPLETITHHPTLEPISILNSFWKFHITDLFQKIFVSPSFAEKTWYKSWKFHWNCKYPAKLHVDYKQTMIQQREGVMVLRQNLDYLLYPSSLEICAEILWLERMKNIFERRLVMWNF